MAKSYPVVSIVGPRQSGKTTLVRQAFPEKPYVNLESPDTLELATSDPRGFLERYPDGVILDEVQRAPSLLSYIQPLVDARNEKGLFILTGSQNLLLHEAVTQSLAGRVALLTLFPLSMNELNKSHFDFSLDESILSGGFPRIFQDHLEPTKAYRNYAQTYVERDLRQLIRVKDLSQFQKFMRLLAGRIGQLLNIESLCGDVGITSKTAKEWISILEASFIVTRLHPYYENFGKRVVKSPKLYFTDVGLATYLLGIQNVLQLSRDPLRGSLVENLVLLELIKYRLNQGLDPNLYFFRDTRGHEVDFIYQDGRDLIPIEVKASMTFNKSFLRHLTFFQSVVGDRSKKGFVVYAGTQEQTVGNFALLNYKNAHEVL